MENPDPVSQRGMQTRICPPWPCCSADPRLVLDCLLAGVISNWTDENRVPPCTIFQAFKYYLDITTPPTPLLLQQFALLATSDKEKKRLQVLSKVKSPSRRFCKALGTVTAFPCHAVLRLSRAQGAFTASFAMHLLGYHLRHLDITGISPGKGGSCSSLLPPLFPRACRSTRSGSGPRTPRSWRCWRSSLRCRCPPRCCSPSCPSCSLATTPSARPQRCTQERCTSPWLWCPTAPEVLLRAWHLGKQQQDRGHPTKSLAGR